MNPNHIPDLGWGKNVDASTLESTGEEVNTIYSSVVTEWSF